MRHDATRQVDNGENVEIKKILIDLDVGVLPTGPLRSASIMKHDIDLGRREQTSRLLLSVLEEVITLPK